MTRNGFTHIKVKRLIIHARPFNRTRYICVLHVMTFGVTMICIEQFDFTGFLVPFIYVVFVPSPLISLCIWKLSSKVFSVKCGSNGELFDSTIVYITNKTFNVLCSQCIWPSTTYKIHCFHLNTLLKKTFYFLKWFFFFKDV